jgi:hypothetical protein
MTAPTPSLGLSAEQIQHMVSRFLSWRLPENFNPDAGISFKAEFNEGTPWPGRHQPTGTNLFDATQATAMVRHMVEGLPPQQRDDAPSLGLSEEMPRGQQHTAIMEAIREDLIRQHPDAFTEDDDFGLVIPGGCTPQTAFVKINVSALAEAALTPSLADMHRYHFTNADPVTVTVAGGETVQIGDGWLAITEVEYAAPTPSKPVAANEAMVQAGVEEWRYSKDRCVLPDLISRVWLAMQRASLTPSKPTLGEGEGNGSRAVPCQGHPAEQGLAAGWRPQIGEQVEVSSACEYAADWQGMTLYVAGAVAKNVSGELNVWLSESWPPKSNGDVTDGWSVDDLHPVAKPTTSAEAKGDGPRTKNPSPTPRNSGGRE